MIAVIGGGPAGLRAAEVAALMGAPVTVYEGKPSTGRKFLVAGQGGLNLTHEEPLADFARRYQGHAAAEERWQSLLSEFGPADLRRWAAELGCETFVATSGRVYPRELKAASLLRSWVARLRQLGVLFRVRHRLVEINSGPTPSLVFSVDGAHELHTPSAVVLAMGGGSWPETGSDGAWTTLLQEHHIHLHPWQPANCGWEVTWSPALLAEAEGAPLKNLVARVGEEQVAGELLITRYGLEGGAIYQLGRALRREARPSLEIDLKPTFTVEQLQQKLAGAKGDLWPAAQRQWKLSPAALALLRHTIPETSSSAEMLAQGVKHCRVELLRPRPLAEAISSAGGVCWEEIGTDLMLHRLPGVFVAGEMIDWEAPTGGYLLQGAFSTGSRAGASAALWSQRAATAPPSTAG